MRRVSGGNAKEIAFHVTLFPAAEVVFIAGLDYNRPDVSGGWMFHEYCFNRAKVLLQERKIHRGTIVTVFSTAKIWRKTRVCGVNGWVDVEVVQLGDPAARVLPPPGNPYRPVAGLDIHISDFYKYLAGVGVRAPHSVLEIGVFSHSWPGGPILYNSGESAAYRASSVRDPADFDARSKDFNDANFPAYDKMKDALAPGCRFTIWGCSATTHFRVRSKEARDAILKGLPEEAFFICRSALEDHEHPAIGVFAIQEENTSELRHRWMMDALFRQRTYPAEAAKRLGIEVRAGCPGTGSDPTTLEKIEMLMVDLAVYKPVFDYFHLRFAPELAETKGRWDRGYVDYHALQSRPAIQRPPFSTAYYNLNIQTKVTRWQPATGAQISFWNGKSVNHPTPNVQIVMKAVPNLVTPGKTGHLFVLKDQDPSKSQAVYVQEDERVFRILQDPSHHWTITGPEL